jgi:hypothetical protein
MGLIAFLGCRGGLGFAAGRRHGMYVLLWLYVLEGVINQGLGLAPKSLQGQEVYPCHPVFGHVAKARPGPSW